MSFGHSYSHDSESPSVKKFRGQDFPPKFMPNYPSQATMRPMLQQATTISINYDQFQNSPVLPNFLRRGGMGPQLHQQPSQSQTSKFQWPQLMNVPLSKKEDKNHIVISAQPCDFIENASQSSPWKDIGKDKKDTPSLDEIKPFPGILIGSVDHAFKWYHLLKTQDKLVLFHVIGKLMVVKDEGLSSIVMLHNEKGNVLKCRFYEIDRKLSEEARKAEFISCTGRMQGEKLMNAYDVCAFDPEEFPKMQRVFKISDRAVREAVNPDTFSKTFRY